MRLVGSYERKTVGIAIGAGLYWGASMLLATVWVAGSTVLGEPSFFDSLSIMVTFVSICLLLACGKWFKRKRVQKLLALAGVAFFCLSLLVGAVARPGTDWVLPVSLVLQGCQTACFIVFWGLSFASLNKEEAERTVVIAALVAFAVYGLGGLIPLAAGGVLAAGIMKSLGVVPFLLGFYDMPVVEREPIPKNYALLKPFFISRVFFGASVGVVSCALTFHTPRLPEASPAMCVLLACAMAGIAVWCFARQRGITSILRVAPILIIGLLLFPYALGGSISEVVSASSTIIVFLSWIMPSVQLSDLKGRVGWDEVRLSFSEKAVYSAGWLTAYLATFALCSTLDEALLPDFVDHAQMIVLYAAILVACYLMANLIERKDKTRILDTALKLSENQIEIIYDEMAAEYGLTGRERDVLALLAKGYSRPLICEKLVIAESTARSHTKHVYQKLGIHSREELYRIVEARQERFSSEKDVG